MELSRLWLTGEEINHAPTEMDAKIRARIPLAGVQDAPVAEICNEHWIGQASYYQWHDVFLAPTAEDFETPQHTWIHKGSGEILAASWHIFVYNEPARPGIPDSSSIDGVEKSQVSEIHFLHCKGELRCCARISNRKSSRRASSMTMYSIRMLS